MTKAWWDNYVGLPYEKKGRTREGTDCWGLSRMAQGEQFGNQLPTLEGDYDNTLKDDHLAEMIAREQEHWQKVDVPCEGDLVLFHVMGQYHVGTVTAPGEFLHIREGQLSTIEKLESPLWKKRFRGFYRYCTASTPITYSAAAHPLRTERVEGTLPPGATVTQIVDILKQQQNVASDMPFHATVWVNSRQVEQDQWDCTIPDPGSRIEMRAVARGADGRMVASIAVMLIATVLAPYLAPAFSGIAGAISGVGTVAAGNLATSLAFTAITIAGNLLINAIFPVRQPDDPGQAERQLLLQGGANRPNPYGTVPVVLGQFRFAPPCAAETYVESDTSVSYLRMAVCWGVGPLQISDLRIGDVPLGSYEDVLVETLSGTAGEDKARFNSIYGRDVHQVSPQILLECPERKINSGNIVINSDVYSVTTVGPHLYSTNALVKITEDYDALAPGYGQFIVREVESGSITVTGPNTFTLPRVKTGFGPLINNGFYQLSGTDYTASSVDWSLHDRNALPENPSSPGALHIPGVSASDFTLNGFAATGTHTYEIKFFIESTVSGSGFQGLAGGAVGALVTTPGWHTQTIVATGTTGVGVRAAANTLGTVMLFEARRVYTGGTGFVSAGTTASASAYSEYVVDAEADQLKVALHFPNGLRSVVKEGGNAGSADAALFRATVQYRQLDSNTLVPVTSWGNFDKTVASRVINLSSAWFNVDNDQALEKVYQWTRISVDEYGHIISRTGAMTTSQFADPTGNLLLRLQQANFGLNVFFTRLPDLPGGEEHLYDICVFGDTVVTTTDMRDASVTGCAASLSGRAVTIAAGEITRADTQNIRLGGEGEPFYQRKDAFTHNITMDVTRGKYEVRIRRTSASNNLFQYPNGNEADRLSDSYLQTITAYAAERPITPPVPMAMTALRIKATNQINGNIDGLTGTATSVCPDYDLATDTWIARPTRNPASLLRYALQHPANIKRVSDSKLDLPAFVDFHNYCRINGFVYDNVLLDQRSVWDVMLDIAAAGRASPTRVDGKHSVIVDKPRTSIVQHFTPHNSWGFESSRALPQHPHAFRVSFNNADKGYQPDERIVYNDGYSDANATLFESLTLPGVTVPKIIFKHARFHFAQLKLRPEQYTLNSDIEHLVAKRGDLVRVTHDVPMWGLGSGRVKDRLSNVRFRLDEPFAQQVGESYTMRFRSSVDGASTTRNLKVMPAGGLMGFARPSIATYVDGGDVQQQVAVDVPRFQSGVMMLEAAATNSIRNSIMAGSVVGAGNRPTNWQDAGTASGLTRTLSGFGVENGRNYVEFTFTGTTTGASAYGVYLDNTIAAASGQTWTSSCLVRTVGTPTGIQNVSIGLQERTGAGVNLAQSNANTAGSSVPTRTALTVTRVFNQATTALGWTGVFINFATGQVVNAVLRIYTPQQELGAAKTSFIPTSTVAVTRAADDYVADTILVDTAIASTAADNLDLYMLGELDAESVELVVHSIEPGDNLSARLTLVDYSPAVYDSDLEVVPAWDSQITLPPNVVKRFITQMPVITQMRSDEAVMTRNPDGGFNYGLKVSWRNPATLPVRVNGVQAEIDYANDNKERWSDTQLLLMQDQNVEFRNLREGRDYMVRLRYVDEDGRAGPWRVSDVHTIVGKSTAPRAVTGFAAAVDESGSQIELTWNGNAEIDISGYEIRDTNTNWGSDTGYLSRGVTTRALVAPPKVVGASKTWYIRAFDRAGLYSKTVTSVTFTKAVVPAPTGLASTITTSSTTTDRITYNWNDATPAFVLAYYEAILTLPAGGGTRTFKARSSEWTTALNWIGTATLEVKTVDVHGSKSTAASLAVAKLVPNTVGTVSKVVSRSRIDLNWAAVAKTTLPVAGYEIRTVDSGFGTAGFVYRGTGSIARSIVMALGANTYYVRAFDTDGNYSAASATISHTYDIPPTATALALSRNVLDLVMTATVPSIPGDLKHFEFRIKYGVTTGDVWTTGYDTVVRSQTASARLRLSQLGDYRVAVRMVDIEGNEASASFLSNLNIAQLPTP